MGATLAATLLVGCRTRLYDHPIGGADDLGEPARDGGGVGDSGARDGGDVSDRDGGDVSNHDGGGARDAGSPAADGGAPDGGGAPRICLSDSFGRPLQLHPGGASYTLASPVRINTYPTDASRLALGDVTGDGRADVVGGDLYKTAILAQRDDGSLGAPQIVAHGFGNPPSVALLDTNGDGVLDLVVPSNNGFDVFDALGGGSFAAARHVPAMIGWDLQIADIDGDGRLDLVSPSDLGPVLLLNDGSGSLGAAQLIGGVGTSQLAYRFGLGDVDGDGAIDVVALDRSEKSLVVLPNVGGSFAADGWTTLAVSGTLLRDIGVGDVTGDGVVDLIAQEDGSDAEVRTWLLAGVAGGGFAAPVQIALGTYGGSVFVGDINGDGRSDVTLLRDSFAVGVLLAGDAGLGPERVYPLPTAGTPQALAVADVDCDGCPDVVISVPDEVNIFAGRGCGP